MSNIKTTYKVVSVLIITISILVFSAPPVSAESLASAAIVNGDYLWSRNMGGASDDKGYSIALDSSGNVYTTGSFQGTVDFDPGAGVSSLISAGKSDIFISKFDNNGNFMWARSMGGTSSDIGYGIAIDSNGNVYTTGYFEGNNIDFDPGPGTSLLTSVGSYDIFISKFDSNGNFVWAKSLDGTSGELGYSISVDSNGNVYTIGIFFLTVDFDPGSGVANLTSVGTHDIFISKLDGNGNFVWVKQLGGTSYDFGLDIDTDASGNIYSVGSFFGSTDFDPNAGAYNLSSAGQNDIFISKLDSNGNFLWAKRMGSTSYDGANGIAIDLSGNVYITGDFYFTVDFDPSAGTARLTSAGELDIFVSKLDGNGNFIWARSMGESEFDSGHEIAVDSRGNVYTTGNLQAP